MNNIKIVSCGQHNSFAISTDGKVYVWGRKTHFQLETGDDNNVFEPQLLDSDEIRDRKVLAVSSRQLHSLFLVKGSRKKVAETEGVGIVKPVIDGVVGPSSVFRRSLSPNPKKEDPKFGSSTEVLLK